ncbi:hypothetical protein PIB30_018636 [Stylosanthes scabra]|uniref:Uncharacterized protein n=1 Tax=Stylosanthes scabra TaxID=79078 RepID=A0ABU6U8Y3_9FABA|nr:hypothetical protein [Stylosanthes scabra]
MKSLTVSLETAQAELRKSREEADYWYTEWKSLDQTRWDPKGKRIYVPEELRGDGVEVAKTLPEVDPEQQQQEQGNTAVDVSGECPT